MKNLICVIGVGIGFIAVFGALEAIRPEWSFDDKITQYLIVAAGVGMMYLSGRWLTASS